MVPYGSGEPEVRSDIPDPSVLSIPMTLPVVLPEQQGRHACQEDQEGQDGQYGQEHGESLGVSLRRLSRHLEDSRRLRPIPELANEFGMALQMKFDEGVAKSRSYQVFRIQKEARCRSTLRLLRESFQRTGNQEDAVYGRKMLIARKLGLPVSYLLRRESGQ